MEFLADDWRDIQRYFGDTYVKLPLFGDKVFYITEVKPTHVFLKDREGDVFKIELAQAGEPAYSLEYVLPHKAVFFYNGKTYLLRRKPARQYHRGCCVENTAIVDIVSGKSLGLSFEVLEAFTMKPPYFTIQQALEKLSSRVSCVPLTKRFSLARDGSVFVDNRVIGLLNKENKTITMFDTGKIFAPEMKQLLTNSDLPFGVIDVNHQAL